MICSYGCNQEAKFQLKNGKWCCLNHYSKCPEMRRKNSESVKKSYIGKEIWYKQRNVLHPMSGKIPWNKGLTKETDTRIQNQVIDFKNKIENGSIIPAFKGKIHTQATKDKIAKTMMGNSFGNHNKRKQVIYKNFKMNSSWEVLVARYFDENKINWRYEEKRFTINEKLSYVPDFFIYDSNFKNLVKIVEVKGLFRGNDKEKIKQFQEKYPEIKLEIWDYHKLKELNLIDSGGYPRDLIT